MSALVLTSLTQITFPQQLSYSDLSSIKYIKKDGQNFPLKSTKLQIF